MEPTLTQPVRFRVCGDPAPGGSKRYVGGRLIVEDARRNAAWRQNVAAMAAGAMVGRTPYAGPVAVVAVFYRRRPKSHYRGVELRDDAPYWCAVRPDATKLFRAVEDAMTGIVWKDDAQVVWQRIVKIWGDAAGVVVTVAPVRSDQGNSWQATIPSL